jgi:hypothetical protein
MARKTQYGVHHMTGGNNGDTLGWLVFAGYCAVGLPVAWLHLRREKITNKDAADNRSFTWVIFFLALLWRILLLAMGANRLGKKMDGPRPKNSQRAAGLRGREIFCRLRGEGSGFARA